jgi:hypothetical protein
MMTSTAEAAANTSTNLNCCRSMKSMASSNSQDAWDEICVNPHQSQIDVGRQEGRAAGLEAGFNEGYSLGRTKGIEFGMELGFILGFLDSVQNRIQADSQENDTTRNERLQTRVDGLRKAIEGFPTTDTIFAATQTDNDAKDEDEVSKNDSEGMPVSDGMNIVGSMQRIRAKFKVLCVQLKLPAHLSLKQVMTEVVAAETDVDEPVATDDSQITMPEW